MGLETGTYISDLVATNPLGSDNKSTADDHLRLIKSTIKASFPNVNGAVNPTPTEFNYLVGVTSAIQTQINTKGAIAGQAWTGTQNFTGSTITATTQTAGDNSTKVATTAYVDASRQIGDWIRLSTATASASATVDFASLITSTYDLYVIELQNVKPATNTSVLYLRTSTNNGVSYDAGATDYNYSQIFTTGGTVSGNTASNAQIPLTGNISSTREGYSGFVYITRPSVAQYCQIRCEGTYIDSTATASQVHLTNGTRATAADVDAIRFLMSAGNIASGVINLYGVKKT